MERWWLGLNWIMGFLWGIVDSMWGPDQVCLTRRFLKNMARSRDPRTAILDLVRFWTGSLQGLLVRTEVQYRSRFSKMNMVLVRVGSRFIDFWSWSGLVLGSNRTAWSCTSRFRSVVRSFRSVLWPSVDWKYSDQGFTHHAIKILKS